MIGSLTRVFLNMFVLFLMFLTPQLTVSRTLKTHKQKDIFHLKMMGVVFLWISSAHIL
jgi:hypothetical protein